jgi:hypothetical protein
VYFSAFKSQNFNQTDVWIFIFKFDEFWSWITDENLFENLFEKFSDEMETNWNRYLDDEQVRDLAVALAEPVQEVDDDLGSKVMITHLRPILNFAPRGKLWPPGVKLSPRGEFCPPGVKLSPGVEIICSSLQYVF